MVTINPFRAPGERHIVGEADKPDYNVFLVGKVAEAVAHVFDEFITDVDALVTVVERCDQVPDSSAVRVSGDVTQLADRFHAADFHLLDLVRHEEFFQRDALDDFVIPNFDFYAPVKGPPLRVQVRCKRPCIARPLKRDGLRRQRERCLEVFRDLAGPFA